MGMKLLKVSSGTGAVELASALAHSLYANRAAKLRAVGPMAVSQAAKSVAIAQGYANTRDLQLTTVIAFVDVTMPEGKVSGLEFTVTATESQVPAATLNM